MGEQKELEGMMGTIAVRGEAEVVGEIVPLPLGKIPAMADHVAADAMMMKLQEALQSGSTPECIEALEILANEFDALRDRCFYLHRRAQAAESATFSLGSHTGGYLNEARHRAELRAATIARLRMHYQDAREKIADLEHDRRHEPFLVKLARRISDIFS